MGSVSDTVSDFDLLSRRIALQQGMRTKTSATSHEHGLDCVPHNKLPTESQMRDFTSGSTQVRHRTKGKSPICAPLQSVLRSSLAADVIRCVFSLTAAPRRRIALGTESRTAVRLRGHRGGSMVDVRRGPNLAAWDKLEGGSNQEKSNMRN